MDRRWPWKKKSSEKASTADSLNATLPSLDGNQADQVHSPLIEM